MSDVVTAARAAEAVLAAAAAGADVAVALLIVPGQAVRRMIVHADGRVEGSLGNGMDGQALQTARELLSSSTVSAEDAGARGRARGESIVPGDAGRTLFVEVHRAPEQLIIVGAGHIAVPLAQLGVLLDFAVTVLDDREDMATQERFAAAVRVIRADFAKDPFAGLVIGAKSYIALVTRGHRWDFDCLQRLVRGDSRPRYIGMIGSRRRVRAAFHALLESGVSREVLAGIRAPIGLELQAETPGEIALAIAAEIVAVRHGAGIASLSSRERVLERFVDTGDGG